MLEAFTHVTGYHRKAAIRILGREHGPSQKERRGRPRTNGPDLVTALRLVWEASDQICSRRLQPFLPELAAVLERHQGLVVTSEVQYQLCQLSPATVDRLLRPFRQPSC